MPKNKRPVPRKSSPPVEEDDDVLAQSLADLALDIAEQEDGDAAALRLKQDELQKLVRNALRKKNDDVLYGAIERASYADAGACQYLRSQVEEASATVLIRRDGAPMMEINAFLVPLFVHSTGGLKQQETFQDGAAFDALVQSFSQAGLESERAKVVLISHAYDLDEIDRIAYSQLNDMTREAAASVTDKKVGASPALERSIAGWSVTSFAAGDQAMELRFLLGFALKRADDPFYAVPAGEAEADAYFAARMARYRQWTVQAAPLVQRCLAANPSALELNFLYQDLFFGGKEQGMAELAMLALMSDINQALEHNAVQPAQARVIVAPAEVDDELVLRVNVYSGENLLASPEKPLDLAADLQSELDDICDALATIGITDVRAAPPPNR
jgi:hypothetical protein